MCTHAAHGFLAEEDVSPGFIKARAIVPLEYIASHNVSAFRGLSSYKFYLGHSLAMEKRVTGLVDSPDPEKSREASTASFDLDDKDEALRLVGLERVETFTEEDYRRVRRKLVCRQFPSMIPA